MENGSPKVEKHVAFVTDENYIKDKIFTSVK